MVEGGVEGARDEGPLLIGGAAREEFDAQATEGGDHHPRTRFATVSQA